jgi:hypothetical protein
MDRRRFVPSTEGLEGRALLASLFGSTSSTQSNAAQELPQTFKEKVRRIERLPFYLGQFLSGRYLPPDTIQQLQTDMLAVAGRLHPPGSPVLEGFNSRLRDVLPSNSLSVEDAAGLSQSFGAVLTDAGATPQQTQNLQDDMNALARNDANSPQPVFLATNDYTLVLETLLGVGRPIRRPAPPQLAAQNGTRVSPRAGVTPKSEPTLVGTYDAFTTIQIVDTSGNLYGSAEVHKNGATQVNGTAQATGKYAVTLSKPLADGLYTLYARAVDAEGHMSPLSPSFKLKVITRQINQTASTGANTPGGPLALNRG